MFRIKSLAPIALALTSTATVLATGVGALSAQPVAAAELASKGSFVGDRLWVRQGPATLNFVAP